MSKHWKKGRGKLGFMQPLLGDWLAQAESPMGPLRCRRTFEQVLGGSYIRLVARWEFGAASGKATKRKDQEPCEDSGKPRGGYEEIALIGAGDEGKVCFWSFTSDGKRSNGVVSDVTDIHPEAIGFEAQMPAGLARMAYWPDEDGKGFYWIVESKTAKGWRRFVTHHYRRDTA